MGTSTVLTFVIIVYGLRKGGVGFRCNGEHSELRWGLTRSSGYLCGGYVSDTHFYVLDLNPYNPRESTFLLQNYVYINGFLFWSNIDSGISVFPAVCTMTLARMGNLHLAQC